MKNAVWTPERPCYRAELKLDLPPFAEFIFRNSNNMSPILPGSAVTSPSAPECELPSQDVIVVGDEASGRYILAGALTAKRSMTYFTLVKRGRFDSILVKQPDIAPGDTPEEILVLEGSDWRKLLTAYADRAARAMAVKPIDATKNVTGYCTWYYYYAGVTEKDFLENLEALKKNRTPYAAQYVQIDDGYQTFQGDWLDQDPSWPTPLKEIGKRITDAGMRAGIWTMPMLASTASRVYREHPDWFVRREDGAVLEISGWSPPPDNLWVCLDATQEAVREHLTNVFQTFRSWGFSYFKMDGLCFGLPRGRRSDPDATPVSAFRLALKTIRDAVPDATLLGCCPPYMPLLGLVDHCRTSPDTSRYFHPQLPPRNCDYQAGAPCIANALHATESRFWWLDRFFRGDPDTLMARQDNAFYTIGEARISVMTGILTGVCITSDHLGTIAPDRLELLGRAARYRLRDAMPADWKPYRWPQIFTGTVDGKKAAAVINDSDETITYDFAQLELTGTAEEVLQPLGECTGSLTLPAHDAALLIQK